MIVTTGEKADAVTPTESYGSCPSCQQQSTYYFWCASCEYRRYQDETPGWTSGNKVVDVVIKDVQRNAPSIFSFLEWIPYNKLRDVKPIRSGGHSTVYSAIWMDGPRDGPPSFSEESSKFRGLPQWLRRSPVKVAFKVISKSQKVTTDYFDELRLLCRCAPDCESFDNFTLPHVLRIYGLSIEPSTKEIIVVMQYADQGDLYHSRSRTKMWPGDIIALKNIAQGLSVIHRANILHRNLHGGNVLQHGKCLYIGDAGFHRHSDGLRKSSKGIYGNMPYIAPEVLRGEGYTKKADIYSFGIIMWEILSCQRAFADRAHDAALQTDICKGSRPPIADKLCKNYVELIQKCWHPDPAKRPLVDEILNTLTSLSVMMSPHFLPKGLEKSTLKSGTRRKSRFITYLFSSDSLKRKADENQQVRRPPTVPLPSLPSTKREANDDLLAAKTLVAKKIKEIRKYKKLRSEEKRDWNDQDFRILIDWVYWEK